MWCARWRRSSCRARMTALPMRAIPEPCCSAGLIASTALPARSIPSARTAATMASFWTRRAQRRRFMISIPIIVTRPRRAHVFRLALLATCALTLGGCYTTPSEITGSVATDPRQRHPIVIKEGPQTVDLFIGDKRGTLTGSQRAEVLSFANEWRREATGGTLIDGPAGNGNTAPAANAAREVRAILAAAGVPANAVQQRASRPQSPAKLQTLRLHYPRVMADVGPCGMWPHDLGPTYE